jgi:hypothetical protein
VVVKSEGKEMYMEGSDCWIARKEGQGKDMERRGLGGVW